MFDATPHAPMPPADPPAETARLQRSRGAARVQLGSGARLELLEQSGAAKAFLPRIHGPAPEVVFLNTSGGLTGGDEISFGVDIAGDVQATATTQTAERAYAAAGGLARMRVSLSAGPGAALDWLPQETILYDTAGLDRSTRIDLASDARLVWAEMLVLGRAAMGETLAQVDLRDRREIWRAGRLAMAEPVRLDSSALATADGAMRAALTGGLRAFATVVLVARGAEDALGPVRAALPMAGPAGGLEAAASAWDGRCVVRIAAADALPMKHAVAAVLAVLRGGRPLPRVWQI